MDKIQLFEGSFSIQQFFQPHTGYAIKKIWYTFASYIFHLGKNPCISFWLRLLWLRWLVFLDFVIFGYFFMKILSTNLQIFLLYLLPYGPNLEEKFNFKKIQSRQFFPSQLYANSIFWPTFFGCIIYEVNFISYPTIPHILNFCIGNHFTKLNF
jgi:hypothetical protein